MAPKRAPKRPASPDGSEEGPRKSPRTTPSPSPPIVTPPGRGKKLMNRFGLFRSSRSASREAPTNSTPNGMVRDEAGDNAAHSNPPTAVGRDETGGNAAQDRATLAMARDVDQDNADRQTANADNSWLDLEVVPAGRGEFRWLNDFHRRLGEAYGFMDPVHWVQTPRNERLNIARAGDWPSTVYMPEGRYLDPQQQPAGAGRWEFFAPSDAEHAQLDFGRNEMQGLGDIETPTATDVWNLRQRDRLNGGDVTHQFHLVWIPDAYEPSDVDEGEAMDEGDAGDGQKIDEGDERNKKAEKSRRQEKKRKEKPTLELRDDHDPTNGDPGGPSDQTSQLQPEYATAKLPNGKKITVDRSTAKVGKYERQKTTAPNAKGKFYQLKSGVRAGDFTDPKLVKKLNDDLNQALARLGFPGKRGGSRATYTDEERTFLSTFVGDAKRQLKSRYTYDISRITKSFNRKFKANRDEGVMRNIIDRLGAEYDLQNPGKLKKRQPRGANRKTEVLSKQAKTKKDSSSDDDDDEGVMDILQRGARDFIGKPKATNELADPRYMVGIPEVFGTLDAATRRARVLRTAANVGRLIVVLALPDWMRPPQDREMTDAPPAAEDAQTDDDEAVEDDQGAQAKKGGDSGKGKKGGK